MANWRKLVRHSLFRNSDVDRDQDRRRRRDLAHVWPAGAEDRPRVDAYGCVDELNSALGLVRAARCCPDRGTILASKRIVTVMGELATAPEDLARYEKDGFDLTTAAMVDRLTSAIDELEKDKSLYGKGWAIPGNTPLALRSISPARPVGAPNAASPHSMRGAFQRRNPALPEPPLRSLLAPGALRRENRLADARSWDQLSSC